MNQSNLTQETKTLSIEEQITHQLHLMKEELAQEQGPNFKTFWELRKAVLLLFKEPITSTLRSKLWATYLTVADEARMAKNHVEEGAKFAVEQLDLAITALEKEHAAFLVDQSAVKIERELPILPKAIVTKKIAYLSLEKKIQLLYIFSSKVIQLREELVKLPMRMRLKAKYFDRLSLLGDQIFPLRKEYMATLGQTFVEDVSEFALAHFSPKTFDAEKMKRSLFFYREEIKKFQALGQQLSLQSAPFTTSRKQLSHCWDQLKGMEKEVKKEMADHKAQSTVHADQIREKIASCKVKEGITLEELGVEIHEIQKMMQSLSLVKTDVVSLKEEIVLLSAPLFEQEKKEQEARKRKIVEEEEQQAKLTQEFATKLHSWLQGIEKEEVAHINTQFAELRQVVSGLKINKMQRQQLQHEIKKAAEKIEEIKEKRVFALSTQDQNALAALTEALKEQQELRRACKEQMESYRKKKGSRALDFLQALELEDLIESERRRLEKIDKLIEEIKTKISEIN